MKNNNWIYIIIISILSASCAIMKTQVASPPESLLDDIYELYYNTDVDTIFHWVKDKQLLSELPEGWTGVSKEDKKLYMTLDEVKKKFYMKDEKIRMKGHDMPYFFHIHYRFNKRDFVSCNILWGKLKDGYETSECSLLNWKSIGYSYGDMGGILYDCIDQNPRFENGNGRYKDFGCYNVTDTFPSQHKEEMARQRYSYHDENGVRQYSRVHSRDDSVVIHYRSYLKEEGDIKNNYKVGKWKYYDREGNIIREADYKLKDKIDVRFPYCIFNKKEPCFCDEYVKHKH